MKHIYRQPADGTLPSALRSFGITNCHFKNLRLERDSITKKEHHHTGFELHIVLSGAQVYQIGGVEHRIESGQFLLIGPGVPHRPLSAAAHTHKYGISFNQPRQDPPECFAGRLTPRMEDRLRFLVEESAHRREISAVLVENCILELLVTVFRMSGWEEKPQTAHSDENPTLVLARQYIRDNIERALTVTDVAQYCYLSSKQLTRIFADADCGAPGDLIRSERIRHIEKLMAEESLSLREISERMNFSSEYYFNAFFRRHAGMPPGEYRKMVGK